MNDDLLQDKSLVDTQQKLIEIYARLESQGESHSQSHSQSQTSADMVNRERFLDLTIPNLKRGFAIIKDFVKTLPDTSGVYRMIGINDDILYVGKAKNLQRRVTNYTNENRLNRRLQLMVAKTVRMEFSNTSSEAEALLLEANLIKSLDPKYNILLKDDKSFAMLLIRKDHDYPQILKHRGKQTTKGKYFGPFASTWAVNQTIEILEKIFLLRTCSDGDFSSRTRACLLYQIKRCSGPCVNHISTEDYSKNITLAESFLSGRSSDIQREFAEKMQNASDNMDYEQALIWRDRIKAMTNIQSEQNINMETLKDVDIFALVRNGGKVCVEVVFFRGGRNYGNRSYFPKHSQDDIDKNILSSFIMQFYNNRPAPHEIMLNISIPNQNLIIDALTLANEDYQGIGTYKIKISSSHRGDRSKVISHAENNANQSLSRKLMDTQTQTKFLDHMAKLLDIPYTPKRIEVYDNSHIQGTNAIGAMIVAGKEGFIKKAYRKFNIKHSASQTEGGYSDGDDFAMMHEVLTRRLKNIKTINAKTINAKTINAKTINAKTINNNMDHGEDSEHVESVDMATIPDIIIVDGGRGQLNQAHKVLLDLNLQDHIKLMGVAKGERRNSGDESLVFIDKPTVHLALNDPLQYFIQRLRDESHRFAIGTHRTKRSKDMLKNPLDEIKGVGAKRKTALLHHFGSAKAVSTSKKDDLLKVNGVSKELAESIHNHFHPHG